MLPQLIGAGALTPELEQTTHEMTESLEQYGQEIGDEIRRVGHIGPYRRQLQTERYGKMRGGSRSANSPIGLYPTSMTLEC